MLVMCLCDVYTIRVSRLLIREQRRPPKRPHVDVYCAVTVGTAVGMGIVSMPSVTGGAVGC